MTKLIANVGRYRAKLALIERDLVSGKNVVALPAALAQSLRQASKRRLDISAEIAGDVDL